MEVIFVARIHTLFVEGKGFDLGRFKSRCFTNFGKGIFVIQRYVDGFGKIVTHFVLWVVEIDFDDLFLVIGCGLM